jgi:hypothetical protein
MGTQLGASTGYGNNRFHSKDFSKATTAGPNRA